MSTAILAAVGPPVGHPWHHWAGGYPSIFALFWLGCWFAAVWLAVAAVAWVRSHRSGSRPGVEKGESSAALPRAGTTGQGALSRPLLASDAERDEAASSVSQAVGEGRLSMDEAEQRIDAAYRARHRHELAELVADLPISPSPTAGPSQGPPLRLGLLALSVVMALTAVLTQFLAGLWELWPVALVSLGASALLPRR